ncbi:hypothetical protein [Deinococcus sp.]|uniref:hypothetical protein n=1 Tax=Deinococcus sp. TaxID=47478 RepID=UPI0025BDF050|nr:hypothetical protein [Deinococcus sp.]
MSKPKKVSDPVTAVPAAEPTGSGLGSLARRLAARALSDPRVQEVASGLKVSAETLRSGAQARADERLEMLIEARQARPGGPVNPELNTALAQRRREREERSARLLAREKVLAVATTTEERRVLLRALDAAAWAGGERRAPRYTELLDTLAQGKAASEMAVHRAIWSLAERHVISVSPNGIIEVTPLGEPPAQLLLPTTGPHAESGVQVRGQTPD